MKLLCGSMQDQQLLYIGAAAKQFWCALKLTPACTCDFAEAELRLWLMQATNSSKRKNE